LRAQPPAKLALFGSAAAVVVALVVWGVIALTGGTGSEPEGLDGAPGTPTVAVTGPDGSPLPGTDPSAVPSVSGSPVAPRNPPPPAPDAMTAMKDDVVRLVNQRRSAANCSAVTVDTRLAQAATAHAEDMASRGYFSHSTPEGVTFDARIRAAGYDLGQAAENIAFGQPSAQSVMDAWMASADHRANILNCSLRNIGMGLAYDADNTPYWVQSLASPA
jgi:uncharacterized protein YkwD